MAIAPTVAIATTAGVRAGAMGLIVALGCILMGPVMAAGQEVDPEAMRVQVDVDGGVHYVGQGIELRVGVVASGIRPDVDPPVIAGADVWPIGTDLKPISVSGIGSVMAETNVFVSRFRIVPRRAGTLEVPSIRARLKDRIGRGRPVRVAVRPLPPEGRPPEFLGGVGRFALQAEATPRSVRVGQELDYRITVIGPAAWGMTGPPELKRLDKLKLGLRVEPRPVEVIHEPPSRTFAYRLRPTRPGEDVIPPVRIAAFDPSTSRYVTRASPSVPVRVVAVPSFDPATIPDLSRTGGSVAERLAAMGWWAGFGPAVLLLGAGAALVWVRRRARRAGQLGGPAAARRFAARVARGLAKPGGSTGTAILPVSAGGSRAERPSDDPRAFDLAVEISAAFIRYLEIGIGRPPGALTPVEAAEGVGQCTGSEELGMQAARIAARCDGVLYRDAPALPEDPDRFRQDAEGLFARLGGSS